MVASQNRVQTLLGTDISTEGKKVETTIHHSKLPLRAGLVFTGKKKNNITQLDKRRMS